MVVHYAILAAVAVGIQDAWALRGDLTESATVARLTAADIIGAHSLQSNEGSQLRPWSACNGTRRMLAARSTHNTSCLHSDFGTYQAIFNPGHCGLNGPNLQGKDSCLNIHLKATNILQEQDCISSPGGLTVFQPYPILFNRACPAKNIQFSCLECAVPPALSNQSLSRSRRAADCTAAGQGADWQTRSTRKERSC